MDKVLSTLRQEGESLQEKLVGYRRTLHACPELRMETPLTEAAIISYLRGIGIEKITAGVGGHGVTALIEGKLPGKCLAIRADCDGLPIREETDLPYASQNGNMHACGHDFHSAALLGAAELILWHTEELRGTVKLIFQPYEEGDGGAKRMIADGVLKVPQVDAIIGFHNGCHIDRDYRAGDVLVTEQSASANIFAYRAVFHGTGGHVCLSRTSVNPVYAACEAVVKIRELAKAHPDAVCAVTVVQGGVRNNVIPEVCVIEGSIRSFDREEHQIMRDRVRRIIEEAGGADAASHGTGTDFEPTIDLMSTKNDAALYGKFCRVTKKLYPESGWKRYEPVPMIGEDFARYAYRIPGFYFMLCAKPDGARYPHHHPKFILDETVLHKASVLLAGFALEWQEV
ncbi:MAG: amidohydrolase [Lachnospiraceae bacterium]|nr:amidohydrolase [Lachnospiraceae bacterium]